MRKVIVSTYMALDGVIENPMWTFPYWGDDIAKFQYDDLFAAGSLLLGRETYEGFVAAWPDRAGTDAFADRINAMPKHVVTTTLTEPTWNATFIKDNVAEEITKLKQQSGMNILKYGGGRLLKTLVESSLLDELHLLVYPISVGSGARLFPDGTETKLKLTDTKTFASGVIALVYQPDTDKKADT
jgi:dihydrofolate reductase